LSPESLSVSQSALAAQALVEIGDSATALPFALRAAAEDASLPERIERCVVAARALDGCERADDAAAWLTTALNVAAAHGARSTTALEERLIDARDRLTDLRLRSAAFVEAAALATENLTAVTRLGRRLDRALAARVRQRFALATLASGGEEAVAARWLRTAARDWLQAQRARSCPRRRRSWKPCPRAYPA
jgi:hypothetical protein